MPRAVRVPRSDNRLPLILDAAARLPDLFVWIAGEGPLEAELKAQCTRLGLDQRVRFLGWRNDRGALLAACDVVAFPSRYEPFGTVTVDACAASRPLVAADAVGPAAYVKDGVPLDWLYWPSVVQSIFGSVLLFLLLLALRNKFRLK